MADSGTLPSSRPFRATFWGTGTSTGVPVIGCPCAVCRSADPRDQRRRSSLLLEGDGGAWLIDAGPDFRTQALAAGQESLDAVLLTHAHADHILGLDDLRPLSWKSPITVGADEATTAVVRRAFPYFFGPPTGKSSRPSLDFVNLEAGVPQRVRGLEVLPLAVGHGQDEILGFRVGPLAYLTDCSRIPEATLAHLAGVDTLVLGALRAAPHPNHFNYAQAIEAARQVGARRTWFTHFSHDLSHADLTSLCPPGMAPAHDGLVLEWPAGTNFSLPDRPDPWYDSGERG